MKIALDFDETFTKDPDFWIAFIHSAQEHGHLVWIVTARDEFNDGINWQAVGLAFEPVPVLWCDGRPKSWIVKQADIKIDVWVDDHPEGVHSGSLFTPERLLAWRRQDKYRNASSTEIHGRSRGFNWKEPT